MSSRTDGDGGHSAHVVANKIYPLGQAKMVTSIKRCGAIDMMRGIRFRCHFVYHVDRIRPAARDLRSVPKGNRNTMPCQIDGVRALKGANARDSGDPCHQMGPFSPNEYRVVVVCCTYSRAICRHGRGHDLFTPQAGGLGGSIQRNKGTCHP